MSKNFNLSIPKKRLRSARFKWGQYYSKLVTFFSSAEKRRSTCHNYFNLTAKTIIAVLAVLIATTVPKTAFSQSQDCAAPMRGTVSGSAAFDPGAAGNDYKIVCDANADLDSINQLVAGITTLVGSSKILIEISGDNSGQVSLNPATSRYEIIFAGTIENSGNYGTALYVGDYIMDGAQTNTDVSVENHATVTTGDGRRGISVESYGTSGASFTNHGTITTSGDVHQRPAPGYTGNWPNRRSDGVHVTSYDTAGDVTLINRGTVTIEAKAASGLNGGVAGTDYHGTVTPSTGSVRIENHGTVTTTGDAHEFPVSVGNPNLDENNMGIKRTYRPYGVQAYIENGGDGTIEIENHVGATIETEGLGSRGITAYSESSGDITITNHGTVTNKGGAWQPESEPYLSRPYGVYGNSAGGGSVIVNNYGSVTTGDETKTMTDRDALGDDNIEVSGTQGHALRAVAQGDDPAIAEVINHADGIITTWGDFAHGMSTWANGYSESFSVAARGVNDGRITTNGGNADGMLIFAGDSTDESSTVTATNSGTITVKGDSIGENHTNGISAGYWMDGDDDEGAYSGDALGTVTVTNSGTVEATGEGAAAIAGGYWAAQGNTIENSGDVVININEGSTVTASGNNSVAVIAETHGKGNVDINVVNGSGDPEVVTKITAGHGDGDDERFGYGIYAVANTGGTNTNSDDATDNDDENNPVNDIDIEVAGEVVNSARNITIQAYGDGDEADETSIDETRGVAIYADSGGEYVEGDYTGTGSSNISITNANVIGGDQGSGYAVIFKGGSGTLTLDNSWLEGDIVFTDYVDNLIINDSVMECNTAADAQRNLNRCSQILGDIHFGGGDPDVDGDVMEIGSNYFKMDHMDIAGYPTINFNGNVRSTNRILELQDVRFNVDSINFIGDFNDTLKIMVGDRDSSINGDIDFGGNAIVGGQVGDGLGDDTLTINVGTDRTFDLMGDIKGLEIMNKEGPGVARVNDIVFTASTLNLDDGKLIVSGHLNLKTGPLNIRNTGKLVFEVESADKYGQVTAGSLNFKRGVTAEVFVQLSQHVRDVDVADVQAAVDGLDVLNVMTVTNFVAGTETPVTTLDVKSESTDGTSAPMVGSITVDAQTGTGAAEIDSEMVAMIVKTGVAAVDMPTAPTDSGDDMTGDDMTGDDMTGDDMTGDDMTGDDMTGDDMTGDDMTGDDMTGDDMPTGGTTTASSGGSSGGGGAILGVGLLAVLMSSFMADEDASASFGDYYFNTPQSAYIAQANERGVMTIKETGNQPYQMWIRTGHTAQPMRMTGVSNTGVSGTEVGVNLYNSDTFYINTSVAPNVSAEVGSLNLAAKGEVYSLSSGWRNDRYFGGLRLSHGEFEVNSIVDNPIVNSALISNAKLRNTQAQLRAGMNLGTGALRFTPSASIQVGTYENSEHVAESPALEATIPSYTQDYTSVQLGLKMTSDKWLSFTNGSKWKPQLKFDSIHTDSKDTGSLTLRQSDKAGALSFNTNAGLRSMPDVVNSMSFGAKVKSSANDQAEWKFGFAGLEADGEEYYAAMAAYQLKF